MANKVFEYMSKDHDRLDQLYQNFKRVRENDRDESIGFFHDFKTGLQRHIIWEEDILFPLFEDKSGVKEGGPTDVMRQEHRQIKEILEKIHSNLMASVYNKKLDTDLYDVLGTHNSKEEEILYPWIDEMINNTEIDEIFEKMKHIPAERYDHCC